MQLANQLSRLIDIFYVKPIARWIPLQTFRYAAVGGINLGLNLVVYYLVFHYLLQKQDTSIFGMVAVSAPIMAFGIAFVVTFCTGFWLTRSMAFDDSQLRGGVQLFRYSQVVVLNILINYFGLKLLVEFLDFYPTPSYMSLQVVTVSVSYLASKHYTFR